MMDFDGFTFTRTIYEGDNTLIHRALLDGHIALATIPIFHFYGSLAHLAVFPDSQKTEQKIIFRKVSKNQKKMKKWAHHAPMNYLHKWQLVEAEKARMLGKDENAECLYDQAISGAKENEYIQEEALANELAARFYLEKGKTDTARNYMKEARYCYDHWGAKAKVDHLDQNYPELLSADGVVPSRKIIKSKEQSITTNITTTSPMKNEQLDLTSVMKASQVISVEIQIEKLLSRMMQIIIENAGAEKGCLILKSDGGFLVEAEGQIHREKVRVLQSIPLEVLSLLCSQAAISLENANLYKQQQDYAETLEATVQERTKELKQSLDTIQETQEQLVQSEKMAAIGGMVAGVAHEINTPIGIGVSAASHLEDKTTDFVEKVESQKLKRSELNNYAKTASDSSNLILKNLSGAVKIVQGFKQVAVDQTSGERREFKLKPYIEDVLLSLKPKLKKTQHEVTVNCPEDLTLNSFPGALSQIITNLVMNSLIHGFEGVEAGHCTFDVSEENKFVILIYRDNGKGMDEKTLSKIFDPFFTTKRSRGGSGLGMHIVHNLVQQTFKGIISCESEPEKGMMIKIKIKIPKEMGALE